MATKDLLTRLADAGEDALSRLTEKPAIDRVTAFATSTRDRLDELTKRVRGIDALEARVAKLEKQVATLRARWGDPPKNVRSLRLPLLGRKE